jgi:hypothetical protein
VFHPNEKTIYPKAGQIVLRAVIGLSVLTASYCGLVAGVGIDPTQWLLAIAMILLSILFDRLIRP